MTTRNLRRIARAGLAAGSVALLVAFVMGGPAGEWLFAVVVGLFPVLLIAQAAARSGRSRSLLWSLAALAVLLELGLLGILALSADSRSWVAGLPASTWLMIVALGLGCLVVSAAGYAAGFDRRSD
jgi:hypothetical protein